MKEWPELNERGDSPPGIHAAKLAGIVARFGAATPRRAVLARRLMRIHALAASTNHLARFIIFGSFITAKIEPNDVDIFLLMEDSSPTPKFNSTEGNKDNEGRRAYRKLVWHRIESHRNR